MDASVTVSVVTHQSARHVDACLASLESQGPCVREVLLADSGSSDGTLECVRARHPRVRVRSLGRNAGYAAAHNRNWAAASGAFLLALNPDVVLGPGYVPRLLECLQADPGLGAAGGRLLSPGPVPRIDSAGIAYGPARARFVDRGRGSSPERYASEEDVLGACGAAALYRGTALDAVEAPGESPFAERLFMYYEDVDLCWRLRHAGWRVRYCPDAEAVHERGGSGADEAFTEYHLVRNRLWVSLRNATGGEGLRELPGLAAFELVKLVQAIGRPHLRAALRDQLRGVRASLAERRQQKTRLLGRASPASRVEAQR
ncbi:MAG: glycosyltransferase family 2 protein [Myxococcota bacterium]